MVYPRPVTGDFIISLDMGTTSTKGILYGIGRGVVAATSRRYPSLYPSPGIVEQDPEEVLRAVVRAVGDLMSASGLAASSVAALVFGGILHSFLPLGSDGSPLTRAVLWSDLRASPQSDRLRRELDGEEVRARTGCSIHPLYYPARLIWMKEREGELYLRASRFVSIKEYVLLRLFGTDLVDYSVASGTGILNMENLRWDSDMLARIGISGEKLSTPVETTVTLPGLPSRWASAMGLAAGTPAIIGGSDGPLAHLGGVGLKEDGLSLTVGTSAALRRMRPGPCDLPGTESWCYYMTEGRWVAGGVIHDAGNLLDWFGRTFLGGDPSAFDVEGEIRRALEVPAGAEGLLFLPFFSGERSPRYNPDARGALLGLSFAHSERHILRAMLEGIAFRILSVYRMLDADGTADLVVTGGIIKSPPWIRLLADFLGKGLTLAEDEHSSARGGVLVALRGLGVLKNLADIDSMVKPGETVDCDPDMHSVYREIARKYEGEYQRLFS